MAINQNHLFEELDGVKCAIVEKNASKERVDFLKFILEYNGFTEIVIPSPLPKIPPAGAEGPTPPVTATTLSNLPPETFTVGVTDTSFNPINAIYGRLLKAPGGRVLTLAYWQQKDKESHDEKPYFEG
jgi:hypothetical protein